MQQNNMTMKELPESERPYEKCEKYGIHNLTDAELLAVIIKTGSRGEKAMDLAYTILTMDPYHQGLEGLLNMTRESLMQLKGIGRVKSIQLSAVCELAKRISRIDHNDTFVYDQPVKIADFYMAAMERLNQEELRMMMLDTKNHMIREELVTKGTVNMSLIDPREIMIRALQARAVNIVLVHNHPSGDSTPSEEDLLATNRVLRAGEIIGIHLLDHLIIGRRNYTSMREIGQI